MTSGKVASFTAWVLGAALVVGGGLFLANATGLLVYGGPLEPVIAGGVGLLALPFFVRWMVERDQWWALITAYIFLAMALPVFVVWLVPQPWQVVFIVTLVVVGLPFVVTYLMERSRWWAGLAAYTAFALAVLLGVTLISGSQELLGGLALVAAAGPLWAIYLNDTSRTWALIPAGLITVAAGLIIAAAAVIAIARWGFFYVLLFGVLTAIMVALRVVVKQFDWALWMAVGFGAAAVLAIFFPPVASFAMLALTAGSYIIWQQVRQAKPPAPKQKANLTQAIQQSASQPAGSVQPSPATRPSQPTQPLPPQPSAAPTQASAKQDGATLDRQATAAHQETEEAAKRAVKGQQDGSPVTGFRPLNPFEGRETDDDED